MLVETKAKVGVFSIALQAYLPQFPELVPEFEEQYAAFKKTLPETVELIDGGLVTTKEQAQAAGDVFRAADVDLVILQLLTYCTSYNMLPAVRDLDVPIVVVNLQKLRCLDFDTAGTAEWLGTGYAGGAVGEMIADLNRAGKRHAVITGVVEGGDPEAAAQIEDWCLAAQVRRRFRDTNIAQIGRPYPGMAIAAKIADIHNTFEIKGEYEEESIREMARYVLAFEQWVRDEQLGLVASHYDGLAQGKAGVLDSMLIPAFSMLVKQGTVCAVEGDMKVAMGMSIMKTISGACQLSEFYTFDFNDDVVLIGHSGSGDACFSTARKASMEIVPVFHGKTGGGFLTRFYPKPGPVTYLAITQDADGHFKFIVSEGVIEDGPTLQNGDTTFRTRFSIGAREWNNRWCECGPTHHFAAAQGSWTGTIQKVAEILNVPVEVVC